MPAIDEDTISKILQPWNRNHYNQNAADVSEDLLAVLNELSELLEEEINKYEIHQPDPLMVNPYYTKQGFNIGKLQHALLEEEMWDVSDKIHRIIFKCITEESVSSDQTAAAAARLWLNCLYFLDHHPTSCLKNKLYCYSTKKIYELALCSVEPHNLYAIGILAKTLKDKSGIVEHKKECVDILKHFLPKFLKYLTMTVTCNEKQKIDEGTGSKFPPHKKLKLNIEGGGVCNGNEFDISNSDDEKEKACWNFSGIISDGFRQRLYLDFLIAIGEDPFFVNILIRNDIVAVAIHLAKSGNPMVQFKAFQFLGTICRHDKCAIEIVKSGCVELAISIPEQSLISSTGASLFLHKLSMNEEAMKIVCNSTNLEKIVKYALELVQGSHTSATCNAVLFFSESFQFENFMRIFDKLHGLQKLVYFLKTSELFSLFREGIHYTLLTSTRPILESFSICLEKYFIKHLLIQTANMEAALSNSNWSDKLANPLSKITRTDLSLNELERGVDFVRKMNCMTDAKLRSVADQFINNGTHIQEFARDKKAMKVLIRIISMGFEWNESFCSLQIRKSSLTALMIVTLSTRVQPILINGWIADSFMNGRTSCIGMLMDIINPQVTLPSSLHQKKSVCRKTKFTSHYEVFSKLALQTLLTCAYHPECDIFSHANTLDKRNTKSNGPKEIAVDDQSSEIWRFKLMKNIQERQGIHVLTYLLQVNLQTFQIGTLVCRILCCLAQISQVKKVIANMPLFRDGKLQCQSTFSQWSGSKKDYIVFSLALNNLLYKVKGNTSPCVQQSQIEENENKKVPSFKLDVDCYKENGTENERQNNTRSTKISFSKGSKCRGPSLLSNKISTYEKQTERSQNVINNQNKQKTCVKNSSWMLNGISLFDSNVGVRSRVNIATTVHNIQLNFEQQHIMNQWNDEFTFSRFSPSSFVDDNYHNATYLCSAFYDNGNKLLVGDDTGSLTVHNVNGVSKADSVFDDVGTTENITKIRSLSTHPQTDCFIVNLIGSLCHWVLCRLNGDTISYLPIQGYSNVFYAEFAKNRVDRAIGTRHNEAIIIDLNKGERLFSLCKLTSYARQSWNRATYSWDDSLILSSSMLWDPRVSHDEPIHTFDVFSNQGSSLFHPNGREIILNSSIWDMRMYNLINTVPDFNCSKLYFNSTGSVIYSVKVDDAKDFDEQFVGSNLRTYSAHDYKHLYTFQVKNDIINFAADNLDQKIALVEKIQPKKSVSEDSSDDDDDDYKTKCRLYDIGKSHKQHEYLDEVYPWYQPKEAYDLWEPYGTDFIISDSEGDDPGDLE